MDIRFFKKKLIECKQNNRKIIILGRGFSSSLFLKNIKKNKGIIIGFNTDEIIDKIDFYFTNKKKIPNKLTKKKLIEFKEIISLNKNEVKIFKIGAINYSIDPLLFFINKNIGETRKPLEIIFVGFDFRTSLPEGDYKRRIRKNLIQSHIDVSSQRDLFFKRKKIYKNIKIKHAGFDLYSDIDPRENFVTTKINNTKFKVKIVAEITTNHHGETKKIIDLISGAKKAGADYVKFQMRNVETFYPKKNFRTRV